MKKLITAVLFLFLTVSTVMWTDFPIQKQLTNTGTTERCVLLSSFSTSVATSSDARKHNVATACSNFCWLDINAGGKLSFNGVVGKRTLENGYMNAKVILDGEYTEGVGGGVCQVSSTLYNAWIRAGLNAESVKGHSLPTSYCELSQDATVSDYIDLVLVNNTFSSVYVNGYMVDDRIQFDIYGVEQEFSIKVRSELVNIIEPKQEIVYVKELENGKVFQEVRQGKNGYVSRAYIDYYKDGKLIKSQFLRQDYYIPVSRIVNIVGDIPNCD